jgi:hypothetical protein
MDFQPVLNKRFGHSRLTLRQHYEEFFWGKIFGARICAPNESYRITGDKTCQ